MTMRTTMVMTMIITNDDDYESKGKSASSNHESMAQCGKTRYYFHGAE